MCSSPVEHRIADRPRFAGLWAARHARTATVGPEVGAGRPQSTAHPRPSTARSLRQRRPPLERRPPPAAGRLARVYPARLRPARVSCAGCVLPSGPSPCTWLSHAPSTMPDKTPQQHAAGFPFDSTPPPARPGLSHQRLGSRITLCPGFPLRASIAGMPYTDASLRRELLGPPGFSDVSLPACHGLWTPPDLHSLAIAAASCCLRAR